MISAGRLTGVGKLNGQARLPPLKGHDSRPKGTYYEDLTDKNRYVCEVDRANREVTLLGFGDHSYPEEYDSYIATARQHPVNGHRPRVK